jgi:hypothetical protein
MTRGAGRRARSAADRAGRAARTAGVAVACAAFAAVAWGAPDPTQGAPHAAPHAAPDPAQVNARGRAAMLAYFRDDPFSPLRAFRRYDFPPAGGAGSAAAGAAGAAETSAVLGSAADADVRLDGPGVAPRALRMVVMAPESGGQPARFRLERLTPDTVLRVSGEPWAAAAADTRVVPEETRVEIGPFAVRPYVQADTGILILFDSRRTAAAAFVPPAWFDFDRGWVFHVRLAPDPKPTPMTMQTSLGRTKEYLRVGTFTLDVPGRRALKVVAYRPTFVAGAAGLSILFTDATSGKETYGAGRYLDLEPPVDGVYTIDFNRAYNPLCAYTSVYNCPIPPRENALPVAIRAGEKSYPGHAPPAAADRAAPGAPGPATH